MRSGSTETTLLPVARPNYFLFLKQTFGSCCKNFIGIFVLLGIPAFCGNPE